VVGQIQHAPDVEEVWWRCSRALLLWFSSFDRDGWISRAGSDPAHEAISALGQSCRIQHADERPAWAKFRRLSVWRLAHTPIVVSESALDGGAAERRSGSGVPTIAAWHGDGEM
jgi:hypothetical protein